MKIVSEWIRYLLFKNNNMQKSKLFLFIEEVLIYI